MVMNKMKINNDERFKRKIIIIDGLRQSLY